MNKNEFFEALRKGLAGLPEDDIDERLEFYSEMIDDRIEEGLAEEEAVAEIGSASEIAWQIVADYPIGRLVKKKMKSKSRRKLHAWEIVLLAVGSPIWLSLLIAIFAVVLLIYVSLWSVIVSLWAAFASFVGGALGGIAGGIVFIVYGKLLSGLFLIGSGLLLAGLSIFAFFGCRAATKGILFLTRKIAVGIKNMIIGKGEKQ